MVFQCFRHVQAACFYFATKRLFEEFAMFSKKWKCFIYIYLCMYIYVWGWNASLILALHHGFVYCQSGSLLNHIHITVDGDGAWTTAWISLLIGLSSHLCPDVDLFGGREQMWGGQVLSWLLIPKASMGISSTSLPVLATSPQAQGAAAGESQGCSWEWDIRALCGLRLTQKGEW